MSFSYTCQHCVSSFETHKRNKKFCKKECYFASKNRHITKVCPACFEQFTVAYRFRGQKTCGTKCAGIITSKRLNTREIKKCLGCDTSFEVTQSYKNKGKYCSLKCFYEHKYQRISPVVSLICENCKSSFERSFIRRKSRFCSKHCATSGKNNGAFGKPGSMTGKKAWNNGLTTLTDERLKTLGITISKLQKEQFMTGKRNNKGSNNPNHGNTSETLTPEKRKHFSEAAIKRVLAGVSGYKTGHVTGTYECKKSYKNVKFKSSWELAAMMFWDIDVNITSYSYEPEIIEIDDFRRAIPDFLVDYVDGRQEMIEIKPTAIQELPNVKERLNKVKEKIEQRNITYKLLGNKEISQIIKSLGKEFDDAIKRYKSGG